MRARTLDRAQALASTLEPGESRRVGIGYALHAVCRVAHLVTQIPTTMQRLDEETRDLHGAVDSFWLDLMASGVTKASYRAQLMRTYGFEAPLESALAYTKSLIILDRRERTRSGLIAQDLLALGVSPSKITAIPQCGKISPFEDPAEALGWKYVVERPTQLHSAIKRNVVSRVSDSANALAYLSAHDGLAPARWQQLGALLESVSTRPGAEDKIVNAAKTAFACMGDWFASLRDLTV